MTPRADVRTINRSGLNAQGVAMFIQGLNSLNSTHSHSSSRRSRLRHALFRKHDHAGYTNDFLSGINMDDIETIEVLKNGAAIYGAKAANGVILINTKRNKSMATRIDLNMQFGFEMLPNTMDVMNADQYRAYSSQLLKSTGSKLSEFKFLNTDPNYYYYNMYHNNTDWKDEVYKEAFTQNYSLHIQGGDDVANYNLSVGYMDANATLKKNDMNRFNIRFNTDIVLGSDFTTRFDAYYSNVTRNLRDAGIYADSKGAPIAATNVLALMKSPFLSPYAFYHQRRALQLPLLTPTTISPRCSAQRPDLPTPTAILYNGEAKNKNSSDLTR
jgi:TonB-dependent SusC/RagA subfamily outer membrane receptor